MNICESISGFYKARISFLELMNLPAGMLSKLFHDALTALKSKEGQDAAAAEAVQDAMEGF